MKMMNNVFCGLTAMALLGSVSFADPGETVLVDTENITGGADVIGAEIKFKQGLDLMVVEIGNYNLKVNGMKAKNAGTYFYYPALDLTLFSGVATGKPIPPGGFISVSGSINSADEVRGTGVVSVGAEEDGVHVLEQLGGG